MKPLIFLLLNLIFTMLAPVKSEVLCDPQTTAVLDEKTLNASKKILEAVNLTLKEKQKSFEKLNLDNVRHFHAALPQPMLARLDEVLAKIKNSKGSLVPLVEADGDPLLLVNGIDNRDYPDEWIKPLHKSLDKNMLSYFFKWDKHLSLESNREELIVQIKSLLEKHKGKKLTIIGYSAGGVLTTIAMDKLADDPIAQQIHFHTVAAPLFGYGAPEWIKVGSFFFGKSSMEIGVGSNKKLIHENLSQCTHWVTTNCEMDQHSCDRGGINPQTGYRNDKNKKLPCGDSFTKKIHDESHASVLNRAFDEILKLDEK